MTAITITPRNKKELLALKQFIKVNDLTFEESVSEVNEQSSSKSSISKMPKDFEKEMKNAITIDEFSSKTTSFIEGLSWSK
ncbi:hypothetical protein [Flavobacterium ammonificans]|jgi:hypothetical protein|uniref:hypothetical protein n=1 Tax=Flavobacterium ammonificans TaxID=1751056 RepID=UPI001E3CC7B9|nr:hypothetical protein [Flavobacterium ammonificans]BDB56275.1 hypothetical protein SHINM13_05710 [Flavobacterium ammonificans]